MESCQPIKRLRDKKKSHDTLIPANPNIPTVQSAELHLKFNVSVTSGDHACMGGCKSLLALLPAGIVKLVGGWVEGSETQPFGRIACPTSRGAAQSFTFY